MFSKLRSILIRSVKNKKLNVFGLFFLLAFLILVLSKLSKSYTETLTFGVTYINLPEEIVLTNDIEPKLNLTVSTYGFNLLSSYFYKKTIEIDLKNQAYIHKDKYVWLASRALPSIEKQFGKSYKLEAVQPDTLNLSFGTLSVKEVPVRLNSNVTYAAGYDTLKGLTIVPDSIRVIGPDTEIDTLTHIETEELTLSNIKEHINTNVKLKLPQNTNAVKLSEKEILVTAKVQKFTEGTLEIPVIIKNLPADVQINYFPKVIKVSFEVSLDDYKSVKPSDFKIECDYLEIKTSNKSYVTPQLEKVPDNVKRVKMKQDKIEYIITE